MTFRSSAFLRFFIRLILLLTLMVFAMQSLAAAEKPINVLVFQSYDQKLPWVDEVNRGLDKARQQSDLKIVYYHEYLDLARLDYDRDSITHVNHFSEKYQSVKIDAVIANSFQASLFVSRFGEQLFGKIPFVYYSPKLLKTDANHFTLEAGLDEVIEKNVRLAIQQNPKAKEVVVIGGDSNTSQAVQNILKQKLALFADLKVTFLNNLSIGELQQKLSATSNPQIIFYTLVFRDGDKNITPKEYIRQVVESVPAPVYGFWSPLLGSGVVGGYIRDAESTAFSFVEAIEDYIKTGAFQTGYTINKYIFDWNATSRFQFDALPASSQVINTPVSYFTVFYKEIALTVIVVISLMLLFTLYWLRRTSHLNQDLLSTQKILQDIRANLEYEVQLRTRDYQLAQAKAESASRELNRKVNTQEELFAIIGHELRTPAAAIKMLLDKNNVSDALPDGEVLLETTGHLLDVLDDMKTVTSPEQGISIKLKESSVAVLVERSLLLLERVVQQHHLSVHLDLPAEAYLTKMLNVQLLRQIVLNLIRNAAFHSGASDLWIRVTCHYQADDDCSYQILFEDNGVGIDEANQAKLFQAFARGNTQADGTGLGLHISREYARKYLQGDLTYAQREGGGSVFNLQFKPEDPQSVPETGGRTEVDLQGLNILIVDDHKLLRFTMMHVLQTAGAIVNEADNGQLGLQLCKLQNFDLVITDIFMPEMSGYEFTRKLRETGFDKPVIGLTSAVVGQESEKLIASGADFVLEKPLDIKILKQQLAMLTTR